MDVPIIRIELNSLRQAISVALADRSNEVQRIYENTLAETLTEEWVDAQIKLQVKELIETAIKQVAHNYQLRHAIQELVDDAILKIVKKQEVSNG